jgi:small-conductance mechanosensitive channel
VEGTRLGTQTFLGLGVEEWASLLGALILALAIYLLGRWLIRSPLRSLVRRTPTAFDDEFVETVEPQLLLLVLVLGLDTGLSRVLFFSDMLRQVLNDVFFLLYFGLGFAIAWKLIGFTSEWFRGQLVDQVGEDKYDIVVPIFRRFGYLLLIVIAAVMLLDHFGVNTAGLLVMIALIALVLYFGSRDALADAFSGFVIVVDQPFRVGDRIRLVGMDAFGDVVEIGTRATRIQTPDNRVLVVPNSDIGNTRLFNYSLPDETLRFALDIGLQYGTDQDRIRQIIGDAVAAVDGVIVDKPVEVLFIEFGDRGLIYRVRWWVDAYTDPEIIYDTVNKAMYATLGEEGIQVSFTTYNVVQVIPADRGYLQSQIAESQEEGEATTSASHSRES